MSNPLLKIVETLRAQYNEDQTDKLTTELQMELAASIAMIIPVPVKPVGNTAQAWINHDVFISKMLDEINELYLLDLPKVKADVKKIFECRYNFVHNSILTLDETNSIVKSLLGKRGEGDVAMRDLTALTVKSLCDSALELQKVYCAELGSDNEE